ncbi:MAG: nitrophenyl compound nitroreductase subunit ArsF family protein [Candidatus Omnitrophota bacterium]
MRRIFIILLAVLAVVSVSFPSAAEGIIHKNKVIVYYFHGTFRCSTCHKLEEYSKEAIETNFKDALVSGKLEFKVINIEDKGCEHYVKDYQLYTKSLILSLINGGKETKWINLDKIWEYVGNKERFFNYVKSGVADLLKEAQ